MKTRLRVNVKCFSLLKGNIPDEGSEEEYIVSSFHVRKLLYVGSHFFSGDISFKNFHPLWTTDHQNIYFSMS